MSSWAKLALEVWESVKTYLSKLKRDKVEKDKQDINSDPVEFYNRGVRDDTGTETDV